MNPNQFELPKYIKWKNVGPRLHKTGPQVPRVNITNIGDDVLRDILGVDLNDENTIDVNRNRWAEYINENENTQGLIRNVIGDITGPKLSKFLPPFIDQIYSSRLENMRDMLKKHNSNGNNFPYTKSTSEEIKRLIMEYETFGAEWGALVAGLNDKKQTLDALKQAISNGTPQQKHVARQALYKVENDYKKAKKDYDKAAETKKRLENELTKIFLTTPSFSIDVAESRDDDNYIARLWSRIQRDRTNTDQAVRKSIVVNDINNLNVINSDTGVVLEANIAGERDDLSDKILKDTMFTRDNCSDLYLATVKADIKVLPNGLYIEPELCIEGLYWRFRSSNKINTNKPLIGDVPFDKLREKDLIVSRISTKDEKRNGFRLPTGKIYFDLMLCISTPSGEKQCSELITSSDLRRNLVNKVKSYNKLGYYKNPVVPILDRERLTRKAVDVIEKGAGQTIRGRGQMRHVPGSEWQIFRERAFNLLQDGYWSDYPELLSENACLILEPTITLRKSEYQNDLEDAKNLRVGYGNIPKGGIFVLCPEEGDNEIRANIISYNRKERKNEQDIEKIQIVRAKLIENEKIIKDKINDTKNNMEKELQKLEQEQMSSPNNKVAFQYKFDQVLKKNNVTKEINQRALNKLQEQKAEWQRKMDSLDNEIKIRKTRRRTPQNIIRQEKPPIFKNQPIKKSTATEKLVRAVKKVTKVLSVADLIKQYAVPKGKKSKPSTQIQSKPSTQIQSKPSTQIQSKPSTKDLLEKYTGGIRTTTKTLKRQSNVQQKAKKNLKKYGEAQEKFLENRDDIDNVPPPPYTKQLLPPPPPSNITISIPNINESVAERSKGAKVNGYIVNSTQIDWPTTLYFDSIRDNYVCNVSVIPHPDFPDRKDIARVNTLGSVKHLKDREPRDDYLSILVTSVYQGTRDSSNQWYMEAEPNEKSFAGLQCYSFYQRKSNKNLLDKDNTHPIYPLISPGQNVLYWAENRTLRTGTITCIEFQAKNTQTGRIPEPTLCSDYRALTNFLIDIKDDSKYAVKYTVKDSWDNKESHTTPSACFWKGVVTVEQNEQDNAKKIVAELNNTSTAKIVSSMKKEQEETFEVGESSDSQVDYMSKSMGEQQSSDEEHAIEELAETINWDEMEFPEVNEIADEESSDWEETDYNTEHVNKETWATTSSNTSSNVSSEISAEDQKDIINATWATSSSSDEKEHEPTWATSSSSDETVNKTGAIWATSSSDEKSMGYSSADGSDVDDLKNIVNKIQGVNVSGGWAIDSEDEV